MNILRRIIQGTMEVAEFSPCRTYRYTLWRAWDHTLPPLMIIGLNPSTADEKNDDPTIRKCIKYAKAWGYGGIVMLNLFAFRATDPKVMKAAKYPIGPGNNEALDRLIKEVPTVLCAWGAHGSHEFRSFDIDQRLSDIRADKVCLGLNRDGSPVHPLYQRDDALVKAYKTTKELAHPETLSSLTFELLGTCQDEWDVINRHPWFEDEDVLESAAKQEIVKCDRCGWWCEQSEMEASDGMDEVCEDCRSS